MMQNQTTQAPNNGVRCVEGHDPYACPNCMNTGWLEFPDGYFEERQRAQAEFAQELLLFVGEDGDESDDAPF